MMRITIMISTNGAIKKEREKIKIKMKSQIAKAMRVTKQ